MTKYSKQTYEDHAMVIRAVYEATINKKEIHYFYEGIAHSLALLYGEDNVRFDKERFLKACGVVE